jgi:hypothetical protein
MNLSKSTILTLIVVAGLAAGTALVAGYADKPSAPAQVACQSACDGCPLQGTDACGAAEKSGACDQADVCASPCSETTCESKSAGCCPREAPAAPCTMSGNGGCDMGGCPRAQ